MIIFVSFAVPQNSGEVYMAAAAKRIKPRIYTKALNPERRNRKHTSN